MAANATPNNNAPINGGPGPALPGGQASAASANHIITAIGNVFRSTTGEPMTSDRIAELLFENMGQLGDLAKEGRLTAQQIHQLREYANRWKASKVATQGQSSAPAGFKSGSPVPVLTSTPGPGYPISQTLDVTNPGPVLWAAAQQGRPTLTGGIAGGRVSGTPAQIARPEDGGMPPLEDNRSRRKSTPGDQSMRRSIQDLVSSIDPNVKIEPEVEDLLLNIADEFIDSVTNFGCRLAKHRGGDTLEVRDLQLHLERNHNIRIPGFASDETRISLAQTSVAPAVPAGGAKKGAQGTHVTVRSHRLAQVQQAKRESKLI